MLRADFNIFYSLDVHITREYISLLVIENLQFCCHHYLTTFTLRECGSNGSGAALDSKLLNVHARAAGSKVSSQ